MRSPRPAPLPWSTIPYYYSSPVPLRRQPPAQVVAVLYRATADIEPQRAPPEAAPAPARERAVGRWS